MKPGDDPRFFRLPPPPGRSRESTIVLDAEGRFSHEGATVDNPRLAAAMHTWIRRHPDDGRYVLSNGYDWTYFHVEDAPFFVQAIRCEADAVALVLSDGTCEAWVPGESRVGAGGAVYTRVKRSTEGGPYEAKFTRHAQLSLGPLLHEEHEGGKLVVQIGSTRVPLERISAPIAGKT